MKALEIRAQALEDARTGVVRRRGGQGDCRCWLASREIWGGLAGTGGVILN
jgi:hypothetical protein